MANVMQTIGQTLGGIGKSVAQFGKSMISPTKGTGSRPGWMPPPGSDQDDDYILSFVNKEYTRRMSERIPWELQWRLNLAFLDGNQFCDISTETNAIQEISRIYPWQEREAFNQLKPIYQVRLAKLSRMRPVLSSRPATTDHKDINAAKVASHVLKTTYTEGDNRGIQAEGNAWMEATGTVLYKDVWDPNGGRVIAQEQSTDPETGETTTTDVHEGALSHDVVSSFEFLPDSCYNQSIDDLQSAIHARVYTLQEIYERWGVDVPAEDASALQFAKAMTGMGGLGASIGAYRFNSVKMENAAIVREYTERPNSSHPNGVLWICTQNKVLHKGDNPYMVEEDGKPGLPFTRQVCEERPGVFWGAEVITRCIPVQRRYNALRNRKAEFLTRMTIGQWNVEEDSVDMKTFEQSSGAPGAVHVRRAGTQPPTPVQQGDLPNSFNTEEVSLMQEFSMLSGVGEISRASTAPKDVKSGVAIALLQDQDDTRLAATVGSIEMCVIRRGKFWLRLYKKHVTFPRTLVSYGKNKAEDVIDWVGSDLKSDDVILDSMSAIVDSPAMRQQKINELLGTPLFLDEGGAIGKETKAKLFEMMQLGTWEDGNDTTQDQIDKQNRENRMMLAGNMPLAAEFDDHNLHISFLNKYRLSTDYEELIMENPQVSEFFQSHANQHMAYMVAQARQQAQAQMAQQQQQIMLSQQAAAVQAAGGSSK